MDAGVLGCFQHLPKPPLGVLQGWHLMPLGMERGSGASSVTSCAGVTYLKQQQNLRAPSRAGKHGASS